MFIAKLARIKDFENTDMKLEDKIDFVISQINENFLDLSYEEDLDEKLTKRFDGVDKRLDGIDNSIAELKNDMNERFDEVDRRFDKLEILIEGIEGKLG